MEDKRRPLAGYVGDYRKGTAKRCSRLAPWASLGNSKPMTRTAGAWQPGSKTSFRSGRRGTDDRVTLSALSSEDHQPESRWHSQERAADLDPLVH